LTAEFTRLRVKRGFHTVNEFRKLVEGEDCTEATSPRWIRLNTLKEAADVQLSSTFNEYQQYHDLKELIASNRGKLALLRDPNIPDLVAVPRHCDLSGSQAYLSGQLIFQDKASCFPAFLLNLSPQDGDVIDACAAPGNKTTHLAALLQQASSSAKNRGKIFAFERDKNRTETLRKMVKVAGATDLVEIMGNTDFTSTNPSNSQFDRVSAILLDPSCSGSGILGRDDEPKLHLPTRSAAGPKNSKKRQQTTAEPNGNATVAGFEGTGIDEGGEALKKRLDSLSHFQLKLLEHAMRFPAATKITYSTCSIHYEENESVVIRALASDSARSHGWRLLTRPEQVHGLRTWTLRGNPDVCARLLEQYGDVSGLDGSEVAEACIRCEKATEQGTMGFFVAAFVRNLTHDQNESAYPRIETDSNNHEDEEEEEWNGFSDEADPLFAPDGTDSIPKAQPKRKKKRNKVKHPS
jgi:25S rRNA (cytosine2278-C5)-methyltransferase